jgi:hypothetical protein
MTEDDRNFRFTPIIKDQFFQPYLYPEDRTPGILRDWPMRSPVDKGGPVGEDEAAMALEGEKDRLLADQRPASRGYVMRSVFAIVEELAQELGAQKKMIQAQAEQIDRLQIQLAGRD